MRFISALLSTSLCIGALGLAACSGGNTGTDAPAPDAQKAQQAVTLAEVIAHPRREKDRARDQFRHPQETLEFFEITPGKAVAEIYPGWYTQILAPYLKDNGGAYHAVLFPSGVNDFFDKMVTRFKEKYSDTETYGEIGFGTLAKDGGPILPEGSVDVVLTFRNVHNWMSGGFADQAFSEFYAALKPGGILGVVEHRLPETATQDPRAKSGYVQKSYMKDLAARAGFEFVGSSEVNANPLDTADHPFGVWTLPPRSRLPGADSEKASGFDAQLYKNIGESDRATLKFRKPL